MKNLVRKTIPGIVTISLLACCLATAGERWMLTTVAMDPDSSSMATSEVFAHEDGWIYGTSLGGWTYPDGTISRVGPDGSFEIVHVFDGTTGSCPMLGPLIKGADGFLYGTAGYGGEGYVEPFTGFGTVFRIMPDNQVEMVFAFSGTNGANPLAGVVQGTDGCFYGTTDQGGPHTEYRWETFPGGMGTVFKLDTNGVLTTLAVFDGTNGYYPRRLMQASDGAFYGVTYRGGDHDLGTVFRVTPAGDFTVLVSFSGTNGAHPQAALIEASDGHLYGTTVNGGEGHPVLVGHGYGTVFRMTLTGELTTLISLSEENGIFPHGVLLEVTNGVFWGTTHQGGPPEYEVGWGGVFEIKADGQFRTIATAEHTWLIPNSGLVRAPDGYYYGRTMYGVVYCLRPPEPPVLQCRADNGEVTLAWDAWGSCLYKMEYKNSFEDETWTTLDWVRPEWNCRFSHTESSEANPMRLYRVILDPTWEDTTGPVED